jgi:arylsulfatase A-like enzyme
MKYFASLLAVCLLQLTGVAASRPNLLFVLIDDMGYADLSCYGEKRIETPHIDGLAKEGIRFTQFYVDAPICSPSRTALMTGQYPARWRITSYLAARKENERRGIAQWLDPKAPTLARALREAGYTTGHFGKWHMGGQRDVGEAPLITEYGFDQTLTQFEGLGDRILPLCDKFDGQPAKEYALGSDKLGRGQITWMDRSKVTSGFVDRALQFIQQAEREGKPFFVDVWPDDVHSPFFPPKALRGDGTKKQLYLGVVKATDTQLAPLLDYVRNSPTLRTNTLIVVASDNGPEPGAGSAGLFRGHKGNLYEGGVREPFIVWGPGLLTKSACGTVNDTTVVAGVDLLPSLLRLAGSRPPARVQFDGEDMSASFLGQAQQKRHRPLFWIRPPDRPGAAGELWPDLSMREGDWKLLLMEDGTGAQLYDLAKDPGERQNLAAAEPKVVKRMSRELLKWGKTLPVHTPPRSTANTESKSPVDPRG